MKLLCCLAAAFCLVTAAQAQDDGKAVFERVCTKCHNLTSTARQRNSRERWSAIVDDMVARGSEGTDAELEKIVDYLAKNLGPRIAVNKATAKELAAGLDLSAAAAAAIVWHREKYGPYKNLEQLKKVPSLNAADLETRKDRLDFTESK